LVSWVRRISRKSPELLGSVEPPASLCVEPTSVVLLSGSELVRELYSQTA
jgi:hypothetical protein